MNIELENAEKLISWIQTKISLNANSVRAKTRIVKRGEVYWCHFGINVGEEISKTSPRPAVVVQNYIANQKSSNTIVVPITHSTKELPCLVPITPIFDEDGSVILDGKANTANIVCVSKARLGDFITKLSTSQMKSIDDGILTSLQLEGYLKKVEDKYDRLARYTDKVKEERNLSTDKLNRIKSEIKDHGFCESSQAKIKEILDIQ